MFYQSTLITLAFQKEPKLIIRHFAIYRKQWVVQECSLHRKWKYCIMYNSRVPTEWLCFVSTLRKCLFCLEHEITLEARGYLIISSRRIIIEVISIHAKIALISTSCTVLVSIFISITLHCDYLNKKYKIQTPPFSRKFWEYDRFVHDFAMVNGASKEKKKQTWPTLFHDIMSPNLS